MLLTERTIRVPERPLHVVHVIEGLETGGAERLLYLNLKHLDPRRVRSTVVTLLAGTGDARWLAPIRELGVEVLPFAYRGPRDLPAATCRLRSVLRRLRPDLIHTHLWLANVAGRLAAWLLRIPAVTTLHMPDHDPVVWSVGRPAAVWKRSLARRLDRLSASACARFVAVSRHVAEAAAGQLGIPLDKLEIIYNSLDLDEIDAATPARARLLDELCLPESSRLLLHVGRVVPAKGLAHAVEALAVLSARLADVHLVSVGPQDESLVSSLRATAAGLGLGSAVHFLGARRDVAGLLKSAEVFLFPSMYEGLGMALMEAMAAGLPCIASDIPPLREIVEPEGNGVLVPPGDVVALADAALRLLTSPIERARLGQAAAASMHARFPPALAAARLLALYEDVVTRRG